MKTNFWRWIIRSSSEIFRSPLGTGGNADRQFRKFRSLVKVGRDWAIIHSHLCTHYGPLFFTMMGLWIYIHVNACIFWSLVDPRL